MESWTLIGNWQPVGIFIRQAGKGSKKRKAEKAEASSAEVNGIPTAKTGSSPNRLLTLEKNGGGVLTTVFPVWEQILALHFFGG